MRAKKKSLQFSYLVFPLTILKKGLKKLFFNKKLTVFLVPEGTNSIKQFRLPRFFHLTFGVFFLSFSALFVWIVTDYQSVRVQMPRLAKLEKDYRLKKEQFLLLQKRIEKADLKMNKLEEFDRKLRAMVNLETGEDSGQFRGIGGSDPTVSSPDYAVTKAHRELVLSMHRSLDTLDDQIALGEQSKEALHSFLAKQKTLLASTPSIWPTRGWVTSRFGYRTSPFTGRREFHKGIDISARMNAPILAPADGIVASYAWHNGYGRVLVIKHGYGVVTRYAHLQKALVNRGKYIKRGETIALVGNSGRTTGSHLHYEVHLNGVPINPLRYILD